MYNASDESNIELKRLNLIADKVEKSEMSNFFDSVIITLTNKNTITNHTDINP